MTDQMAVQQGNYAVPGLIGGAAIGGIGGGALAKYGNIGYATQAYKSWEDVVKATSEDDKFIKKMAEKTDDNAANWKVIQEQRNAITEAEKAVDDLIPKEFGAKEEVLKLADAKVSVKEAEALNIDDLIAKAKEGKVELLDSEGQKIAKDQITGKTDDEIKGLVENHKNKVKTDAEKAVQTAQQAYDDKLKTITDDSKKVFDKLDDLIAKKQGVNSAKNTAKEKLTNTVLEACKKPKTWVNAAIGAGVLALAGLGIGAMIKKDQA